MRNNVEDRGVKWKASINMDRAQKCLWRAFVNTGKNPVLPAWLSSPRSRILSCLTGNEVRARSSRSIESLDKTDNLNFPTQHISRCCLALPLCVPIIAILYSLNVTGYIRPRTCFSPQKFCPNGQRQRWEQVNVSVPCTQGGRRCSTYSIHVSGEIHVSSRTRLSHRNKRNSSAVAAVDRETLHFISVRPSSTRKLPYQVSTGFHSMALHSIQGHVVSHLLILVLCFSAYLIQLP